MNLKVLEKLKLYRGATSVIELDFTGFTFENNSYCQLTIKKKYNDDIVFQHDFDKPIKYYVTFKDEFTASLDDDKYKYDIMYMLDDERYPQCLISDIIIDEVVNNYKGEFNAEAVQITEVLEEGAEITQSIKVTTSNVIIASSNLQERTVTPTKEEQVVLAEDGFDGMSKVVVEAIPNQYVIPNLQEKETRITAPTNIFVHPDEEYDGLSFVNVIASVDTETKEVTPSKEVQTINRSDGKYIDSVTVNAIPDEYIIPSGEMEITENGSYDVTDKASVEVATSGADLSEYFAETISGTNSSSKTGWQEALLKLPAFKVTGTTCAYMFYNYKGIELDVSNFDTKDITSMGYMFYGCENLANLDVSNFDTSNVTSMVSMFYGCKGLTNLDVNNFDTSNVTTMREMFRSCTKLTNLDINNFDTSKVTDMSNMIWDCSKLTSLNLSNFDTKLLKYANNMLGYCSNLVTLDISSFDFQSCISVENMFNFSNQLTNLTFGINLGKGYTQKTTNYSSYKLDLSRNYGNLTHNSLMDVINKLYDLNLTYDVANGGTLYTQSLVLGADNMAKLTEEEIAIATAKGWTVS